MLKKSALKGRVAEKIAVIWLFLKGYKPIAMNDKTGGIETDLIVNKGKSLVLVEVKFRNSKASAHNAIHPSQQVRLQRKLRTLSSKNKEKSLRIDLVLIYPTPPFIEHIENVFSL